MKPFISVARRSFEWLLTSFMRNNECNTIEHSIAIDLCQSVVDFNSFFFSIYVEVAYGSLLTLKNCVVGGGYLHSHVQRYPPGLGAHQQQITTYAHKDDNNKWYIKKYDQPRPRWKSTDPIELVRNGDLIRLEHLDTSRNLHSHKQPAPITFYHNQVTGFGFVK